MALVIENIRRQLIIKEIKLWEEPYYDQDAESVNSLEIEKLSRLISLEQEIDFSFVLRAIYSLQSCCLSKFELAVVYEGAKVPDLQLPDRQIHERSAQPAEIFDNSRIDWGLKQVKFYYIDKSIRHYTAPKFTFIEPTEKCCKDYSARKCDPLACHKAKEFTECFKCGPDCKNQRFKNSEFMDSNLLRVKFDEEKGLCLFTDVEIQPDTWVIEYVGEIMSYDEYNRKIHSLDPAPLDSYGFQIDNSAVIDAKNFGNLSRFISHSCLPNMSAGIWTVGAEKRVVFQATRLIEAGKELTVDYGDKFKAVIMLECKCGYINCRGQVGGKYSKKDRIYTCDTMGCDARYQCEKSYRNHRNKEHKDLEERTCRKCDVPKIFQRAFGLQKHNASCHLPVGDTTRKRGRRRKTLADKAAEKKTGASKPVQNATAVQKRRPGRPRKHPLSPDQATSSPLTRGTRKSAVVNKPRVVGSTLDLIAKKQASNTSHPPAHVALEVVGKASVAATETNKVQGRLMQIRSSKRVTKLLTNYDFHEDDTLDSTCLESYDEDYVPFSDEEDDDIEEEDEKTKILKRRRDALNAVVMTKKEKHERATSVDEDGKLSEKEDDEKNNHAEEEGGDQVKHAGEEQDEKILKRASTKTELRCNTCNKDCTHVWHLHRHQTWCKSRNLGGQRHINLGKMTFNCHNFGCKYTGRTILDLQMHQKSCQRPIQSHTAAEASGGIAFVANVGNKSGEATTELPPKTPLQESKQNLGPGIQYETLTEDNVNSSCSGLDFACMLCDFIGNSELSALEHALQHKADRTPLGRAHL